jgi:hypothetical protein
VAEFAYGRRSEDITAKIAVEIVGSAENWDEHAECGRRQHSQRAKVRAPARPNKANL